MTCCVLIDGMQDLVVSIMRVSMKSEIRLPCSFVSASATTASICWMLIKC